MAENKNSFILYTDQRVFFEKLSDEDAGKLIKHIFSYVNDENPTPDNLIIDLSFEPIKQTLKRDLKKWEKYIEKQKENGSKGGRPSKPKKPNPFLENPPKPKKADSVSVTVSVSESESKNINTDISGNGNKDKITIDYNKLLEHYNNIFGRQVRVIPHKAKKQIKDRLREGYRKQDFIQALENAKNDQYHIDNNYKYITLEFISRPDKFERYSSNHNFKVKTKIL